MIFNLKECQVIAVIIDYIDRNSIYMKNYNYHDR